MPPSSRGTPATAQNLAERLGFDPHARLLIVHADDVGIARSVNTAFIAGLETGLINSGSAMVPCPAFPEIASFARSHPEADIGLHLTLTTARPAYPWAPTAPAADVPSLVDRNGHFHQTWAPQIPIVPEEVEIELRAQIEKAMASGLRPTHIDSHQFLLQKKNTELFEVYVKTGRAYRLPLLISRQWFATLAYLRPLLGPDEVVLDRIVTISPKVTAGQWPAFYRQALQELPPGVSEILIHPGHDDQELQAFYGGRMEWGAAWRQRDFDFFTSEEFADLLERENIQRITWREIVSRLQQG
jgi:predicted glycoside hydrolase/deacetylase ChbG (UPF0249 family)